MDNANKCVIYAEMHLVFDNDFDVNEVTKILNLNPTECKCRWETRKSSLTGKHLEGFWTLKSREMNEWDLKIVLNDFISMFYNKLSDIKYICETYDGAVIFDIVPSFISDCAPSLYFDRDFLDIVDLLNATIQIDMYVS